MGMTSFRPSLRSGAKERTGANAFHATNMAQYANVGELMSGGEHVHKRVCDAAVRLIQGRQLRGKAQLLCICGEQCRWFEIP